MKKTVNSFFIALIGGVSALTVNYFIQKQNVNEHLQLTAAIPSHYATMSVPDASGSVDFTFAAEKSIHTVVNVKTSYTVQKNNIYFYDPFRYFFDQGVPQQKESKMGSGSGIIISQDGYIVTNNHVIDGADKIEVTLNDKRTYTAQLIGADPSTDLALLKIKETNLSYITYGNSDDVKIGEWVLAVGNPFNLTSTVTAGIISAKARNINIVGNNNPDKDLHPIESFIQTDAAVNPGNSGGALVNTKGELIGINSAIASNTGSYTGYSFAIPVNIARKVAADLLEFGEVQRGFIGVSIRDLDAKLAEEKNISEIKGVYVDGLTMGGSAEKAGIKAGDIILKIGDVSVNNVPKLQEQVSRYRPGNKINVSLKRDNQIKTVDLVLKNRNGDISVVEKPKSEVFASLGATFEPANKIEMKKLNIENGLKITKLQAGKLVSVGIKEGFIVTCIDKKKIATIEDLKTALANKRGGVLIEGIYPNGMSAYYGFGI